MKNKKKIVAIVASVALVTVVVVGVGSHFLASADYTNDYNRTFGEFTAKTASELLAEEQKNTCYSPVSLFSALSLTAEATKDETQSEIIKALGVENTEKLEEMYKKTLSDIVIEGEDESDDESDDEVELTDKKEVSDVQGIIKEGKKYKKLTLCNSLWIDKSYIDNEALEKINNIKDKFECEIFDNADPEKVNEWVDEKTNHLINNILDESVDYEIALVNTLYYKANWKYDFVRDDYTDFYLQNSETIETSYIKCEEENMSYKECNKYTVVSVPMEAGEMVFVVPKEDVKLEKLLKENALNEILALVMGDTLDEGCVTITLPQFKVISEFSGKLTGMLKNMGIKKMFENCQWSISDGMQGLSADINQAVNFNLNKEGVEAAAATAATASYCAGPTNIDLELILDHPFMYILMKDDVPLFIGTVYNPAE